MEVDRGNILGRHCRMVEEKVFMS